MRARNCFATLLLAVIPATTARAADFIIADFEGGLDPNIVDVNSRFAGPVPDGATHGNFAGSITTPSGWGQYLRYDNGNKAAGNAAGELAYYSEIAFDITVPAPDPNNYFLHEIVLNASVFGWNQSGELLPPNSTNKDIKGLGTVTMTWNYRQAIANFDTKMAQYMAEATPYFQVLLISNTGGAWDTVPFSIDNWRLTRYLGDANLNGSVDPDDYALVDKGAANGLTGWENGDFNGDGFVDAADYLLIDKGLAHQTGLLDPALLDMRVAQFGEGYVDALVASVPEPTVAMAAGALAVAAASRRSARRRGQ